MQCDTCHNQRIDWRAVRQVDDFNGLKYQVRRRRRNVLINWSEDGIGAVSDYLNLRFTFFPAAADRAEIDPGGRFMQVTARRHGAGCAAVGNNGIEVARTAPAVGSRAAPLG